MVLEYYAEDLKKLKGDVDKCSIDILNSLEYFLEEANAYSTGIPIDIENEVKSQIRRFKKDCTCKSSSPKS